MVTSSIPVAGRAQINQKLFLFPKPSQQWEPNELVEFRSHSHSYSRNVSISVTHSFFILLTISPSHPHIHLQTPYLFCSQGPPYQQQSAIPTTIVALPCPPTASLQRSWVLPFQPNLSLDDFSPVVQDLKTPYGHFHSSCVFSDPGTASKPLLSPSLGSISSFLSIPAALTHVHNPTCLTYQPTYVHQPVHGPVQPCPHASPCAPHCLSVTSW